MEIYEVGPDLAELAKSSPERDLVVKLETGLAYKKIQRKLAKKLHLMTTSL